MLEINALPVEISIAFRVLAFIVVAFKFRTVANPVAFTAVAVTVAAVAVPVTAKDPTPAAVVTVRVPVTVLLDVNNEPPCIDPENTAVAPFTAPVAVRLFAPTFPENEPDVPETAPSEVREPTWALFVTLIALVNIPLFAWNWPTLQRFAPEILMASLIELILVLAANKVDIDAEFAIILLSGSKTRVHCP
jgi:hypothetical protein